MDERQHDAAPVQAAVPARKPKNKALEFIESVAVALFFALLIRTFIVQAFKIPSGSMEPTLLVGDYLLVNKFSYGYQMPFLKDRVLMFKRPQRGDVVVFKYPVDPDKDFIKRIVAVEGDSIAVRGKKLFVNGAEVVTPQAVFRDSTVLEPYVSSRDWYATTVVPKDSVFVMGDNRDSSLDSRFWGFVPLSHVKGKALIMYWSWDGNDDPVWRIDRKVRFSRIGTLIK